MGSTVFPQPRPFLQSVRTTSPPAKPAEGGMYAPPSSETLPSLSPLVLTGRRDLVGGRSATARLLERCSHRRRTRRRRQHPGSHTRSRSLRRRYDVYAPDNQDTGDPSVEELAS